MLLPFFITTPIVRYLGVEALFEGSEEISEEVGVGVFAELVKHKPVAKIAMAKHLKFLGPCL